MKPENESKCHGLIAIGFGLLLGIAIEIIIQSFMP